MKASKPRKKSRSTAASRRRRSSEPFWVDMPDEELLDVRVRDLGVKIEGTPLEGRIERIHEELKARNIRFRPHCWLSDEWFSPDGIPGIAIPFYLAHPRLARLERKQMLEVEGGSDEWCMKILRHETGHAIDTAFRLRRRPKWRKVFGKVSQPYPDMYQPKPYSKSYVLHLDLWYAQSHPTEDFAETFAVWLKPRSRWRTQYQGWPARKKLEFVDDMMDGIQAKKSLVASRSRVEPVRQLRKTLREHYVAKRKHYGIDHPRFYDTYLRRMFSKEQEHSRRESASAFLRRIRPELRRQIANWTGEYQYTIDQVLREMIDRCRELRLYRDKPEKQAKLQAMVMLTVQTMNYLHGGHHRVVL